MDRYCVDSAGGGVARDLQVLKACLTTLGDSCHETVVRMKDMASDRVERRRTLGPLVRNFKVMDVAGKQAAIDDMLRTLLDEVDALSRGDATRLQDLRRLQAHVDHAERAFEQLQSTMDSTIHENAAAFARCWANAAAASSCWVEVYDKNPRDNTVVRLR